jgi:thiol-disulfide isomerase/thioredoxin
MNDLSDQEEQKLNPSPKAYKTPHRAKIIFVGCALVGLVLYGAMLIKRRLNESSFLVNQEIAPIKLMPSRMPDLAVIDPMTNAKAKLSFADGVYTLLNIWATWCPPCQKEMPSLARLQTALGKKIHVVSLSIDDEKSALAEFLAKHELGFSVFWDHDKASLKFLGVEKYPETFLISPDGYLTTQFSGPRDWSSPQILDYFLNVLN